MVHFDSGARFWGLALVATLGSLLGSPKSAGNMNSTMRHDMLSPVGIFNCSTLCIPLRMAPPIPDHVQVLGRSGAVRNFVVITLFGTKKEECLNVTSEHACL